MQIATLAGGAPAVAPRNSAAELDYLDSSAPGADAPAVAARQPQLDERRRRAFAEEMGLTPLGAILNAERSVAPESRAFARLEGRAAARVRNVEQRTEFRRALREVAGARAAVDPVTPPEPDAPAAAPAAAPAESGAASPARSSASAASGSAAPPRAPHETPPGNSASSAAPALAPANRPAEPSDSMRLSPPPADAPQAQAPSASASATSATRTIAVAPAPAPAVFTAASASAARTVVEPAAEAPRSPVIGDAPARAAASGARQTTTRAAAAPAERNLDANIERIVRLIHSRIGRERSVATLHLEPDSLGSIRLRMELREAAVALEVRAESDLAHRLLSEHLDDLRQALETSGLRLERIEFQPPTAAAAAGDAGPQGDLRPDAGDTGRRGAESRPGESDTGPGSEAPSAADGAASEPNAPALGAARLNVLA
jgi:flagellar hook-length control protein FliK